MLVQLVIALIIIGAALYLVTLIPMDNTIKQIIRVVLIVAIVVWLLQSFGAFGAIGLSPLSGCLPCK